MAKVPPNYEDTLFDHNSQSCVEIKWSSNNINFVDSSYICYYLQKQLISEDDIRDKVAKTDRSKAGGAL